MCELHRHGLVRVVQHGGVDLQLLGLTVLINSLHIFGQIWSDLVRFGQIWSDLVRFGQIWSDLVRFGQIWSDLVTVRIL